MATATETAWRLSPHHKQWELIDCGADIAIYGGAAGGGKSFALLAEPICRGLHEVPGFYGIIFRRTSKQVTEAGALWDQASKIYPYVGGVAHVGALEYRFPSGAKIGFRHIEHEQDKHNYAGSEICYLGFDELYHFTESQFLFLTSRNRSVCGVRPYIRATTNPDPGWLRDFIAPWVHDEYEGERAQSGQVLWQVRVKGKIKYVPEGSPDAKSVTFIRARLTDNPSIFEDDPGYEATLKALPPVERARLLEGDWNVRREGLVYASPPEWSFEDCIVDSIPDSSAGPVKYGGMDFGFHNPFSALWGHLDHDGVLWITGGRYKQQTTIAVHSAHLPLGVEWWCDPSGAEQIRALREAGHSARPCAHMPTRGASGEKKNPKVSGIDMVSERMRTGRLKIVRCPETMPLIRELGMYHYDETKQVEEPVDEDNHACDALRYLVVGLDRGRSVPSITPVVSDAERAEQERLDRVAEAERKRALELAAANDPWSDRWGWS